MKFTLCKDCKYFIFMDECGYGQCTLGVKKRPNMFESCVSIENKVPNHELCCK